MKNSQGLIITLLFFTLLLAGIVYGAGFVLQRTVGGLTRDDVRLGSAFMFDREMGWLGKKNFRGVISHLTFPKKIATAINRDGYRDDDWDQKIEDARARGSRKILVLGDSLVYGIGSEQDQTFPAEAQKYADAVRLNLKFFNAGIPAYGFMHYRRELDRLLDRIVPDEVWLVVCFNDWGDSALPYDFRNVSRVYQPFYDEKGILKTKRIKRRPSLFLSQECHIRSSRFTLVADHLSYLAEDVGLLMQGVPTRWTSPLPISQYDSFVFDRPVNARFPQVRLKIQRLIEDMGGLLKRRNVKFRIVPVDPRGEKMMEGFRAAAGVDLITLPEVFGSVLSRSWGRNLNEDHRNFIWGCFMARYLIDRIFPYPGGRDAAVFRAFIRKELKAAVDFRDEGSFLRCAFGSEWDLTKSPLEPKEAKEGDFAISNPFGEDANVSLAIGSGDGFSVKQFRLEQLRSLKEKTFTLDCRDMSRDGVLFFRVKGQGLVSVKVEASSGIQPGIETMRQG